MRKVLLVLALAFAMVLPLGAFANDVPDGEDCRNGAAPATLAAAGGGEADRGAACVAANGTVLLYVGGEAQADEPANQGYGNACGAIIVGDQVLAGDSDWNNNGPDGVAGTADDEHCD